MDDGTITRKRPARAASSTGARKRPLSAVGSAPYWRRRYWSRRITGRGAYGLAGAWRLAKPHLRAGVRGAIRGGVTGMAGSIGGPVASGISNRVLDTVMGSGAYSVKQNTVWASDESQVPAMHSVRETIRVTHREYIADVFTSPTAGSFNIDTYAVNPGMYKTFPWLSPIAQCFQEYEIKGLVFMFKSNSGDALNSTNTALGSVCMAAQYNPLDTNFNSKGDMLNSMWSAEGKPSGNLMLPIECDPSQNPFAVHYVRSGDIADSSLNIQNYDLCKVSIATVGMQGTSVNIGELWVSYDIELRKPSIFRQNEGLTEKQAHFRQLNVTPPGNNSPWSGMVKLGDDIGVNLTGTSALTFDAGCDGIYSILWIGVGATGSESAYTPTLTNCTLYNALLGTTPSFYFGEGSAALFGGIYFIKITDPSKEAGINLAGGGGTIPVGAISADIFVTKYNNHEVL